jgi:hypothetical protein
MSVLARKTEFPFCAHLRRIGQDLVAQRTICST